MSHNTPIENNTVVNAEAPIAVAENATPAAVKRGRGRPKGSKNKPKAPKPVAVVEATQVTEAAVVAETVTETPAEEVTQLLEASSAVAEIKVDRIMPGTPLHQMTEEQQKEAIFSLPLNKVASVVGNTNKPDNIHEVKPHSHLPKQVVHGNPFA